MPEKRKSVGAFWKQVSRDGKRTYLTGNIELTEGERIKVVIFANSYKEEGSRQPDFMMYISKPREEKHSTESEKGQLYGENT